MALPICETICWATLYWTRRTYNTFGDLLIRMVYTPPPPPTIENENYSRTTWTLDNTRTVHEAILNPSSWCLITARNEVGARLCFHRRVWFCSQGGMHGCRGDGVCGLGVCMVAGGACMVAGGWHVWLPRGVHGCGGVCGLGVCMVAGGACMVARGACMVAGGWHVWLPRGVHGCGGVCGCWGACVVARGVWLLGGCVWLLGECVVAGGGVRGCWGVCMVKGACMAKGGHAWWKGGCVGYDEIRKYDQWAGGKHPTGMHSCFI